MSHLRWRRLLLTFLVFLASLLAFMPVVASSFLSSPQAIVEPALWKQLSEEGRATFLIYLREQADLSQPVWPAQKMARRQAVVELLQATAERSQADVRAFLEKARATGRVTRIRPFWVVNAIVVEGDAETVRALAARPDVARITVNHRRELIPPTVARPASPDTVMWNIRQVQADRVWAEFAITGKGTVVATMDTGVAWTHPALRTQYRGTGLTGASHDYNWYDATGASPNAPADNHGHGTHTMGTILGDDGAGNQIGVAPGARWIAVKVLDNTGAGTDEWIHAGFQWLLAPTDLNGLQPDPSQAPDIVSNSWGTRNIADPAFWHDLQALRAAGIFTVFAAGNEGPDAGTVGSPAGYPHTVAAGATDPNGLLTEFSSRGPGFFTPHKPNVVAPGEHIRSAIPGGGYDVKDGTSMAAPHVAGIAALLLEADPNLSVDDLETVLERTAWDLGPVGFDHGAGAGLVNAYAAVRWVLEQGRLAGQVRDATSGAPVGNAAVYGISGVQPAFRTVSDDGGHYVVAVPVGTYDVTVGAFGYQTATVSSVRVITGFQTLRDFTLMRAPTVRIGIEVRDARTDLPLAATATLLDTPLTATAGADGVISFDVPAGCYRWLITQPGYRRQTQDAGCVTPGQGFTTPVIHLAPAPSILLLDADAWLQDDVTLYYRYALEEAGYLFATRRITDTNLLPSLADLQAYDMVIWSHAWTSPGYVDAVREDQALQTLLTDYVRGGGRLLLTGKDIGYYDGGGVPGGPGILPYYRDVLHARYIRDDAAATEVSGLPGEVAEGISMTLPSLDAYKFRLSPDDIAPADAQAVPILAYSIAGRLAGLRVADLGPGRGRLIYLGFGLERGGPLANRARFLDAALAWLAQPTLAKQASHTLVAPGQTLTYTLHLSNPLRSPVEVTRLSDPLPTGLAIVEGSLGGGAIYDPATREVYWSGWLATDESRAFNFQARLLPGLSGGAVVQNRAALTTAARLVPVAVTEFTVAAADLSPSVKNVDRPVAAISDTLHYTLTLRNSGPVAASVVLTDTLPAALQYVTDSATGGALYDATTHQIRWSGTVSASVTGDLEYTWADSTMPGGPAFNWLDISSTGTLVNLSDDQVRGPYPIGFAFPFFGQSFTQFYISSNGWIAFTPSGTSQASNLRLPTPNAPRNMIAGWWDDLNPGAGGAVRYGLSEGNLVISFDSVPRFGSGGPYTFQFILRPDGAIHLQYLTMNPPLDGATIGIQDGTGSQGFSIVHNAAYMQNNLAIRIRPPQQQIAGQHQITYRAQVEPEAASVGQLTNVATLSDGEETITISATTRIRFVDLSLSDKAVTPTAVAPGGLLTYTILLLNSGNITASVQVTDPIPGGVTYLEGSATGGGVYEPEQGRILWQTELRPGTAMTLTFLARVADTIGDRTDIINRAEIAAAGQAISRTARATAYLPDLNTSAKSVNAPTARLGDVLTYTLILRNASAAPAADVLLTDTLPAILALEPGNPTGGASYDPATRQIRWQGTLPPQTAGYSFLDSDQPGGPSFNWLDIRAIGTRVTGLGDDTNVGPFPIGFPFTFYGRTFTTFRLCSNGFLSFSSDSTTFTNRRLPNTAAPADLLAIWWDDLTLTRGGEVYIWSNNFDTLVVSYIDIPRIGSTAGLYTFQAILRADGSITYQYLTMNPPLNSATIGIQDATGSQGLTVAFNEEYVHNNLAIRFAPPAGTHRITYAARVVDETSAMMVTNEAWLQDGLGRLYPLTATVQINTIDLTGSALTAEPAAVRPGERITYTVRLRNGGNFTATAVVTAPIPSHTTFVPQSATNGATFDVVANAVRWLGPVPPNGEALFGYTVQTDRPFTGVQAISTEAILSDGVHPPLTLQALTPVHTPDLTLSTFMAEPGTVVAVGESVTFTLHIVNGGTASARAVLTATLPAALAYVPGSAWAGSGTSPTYDAAQRTLHWQGDVPTAAIAELRFQARPLSPGILEASVQLADGYGGEVALQAAVRARWGEQRFLPLAFKGP